jgi:hypothetical protein
MWDLVVNFIKNDFLGVPSEASVIYDSLVNCLVVAMIVFIFIFLLNVIKWAFNVTLGWFSRW